MTPVTHKTELKKLIDTVSWDGKTFADYESEGDKRVFDYEESNLSGFPSIRILTGSITREPKSNVVDRVFSQYQVQIFFSFVDDIKAAESDIDTLAGDILDKLANAPIHDNNKWIEINSQLEAKLKAAFENSVYKEITVTTRNEKTRNNPNF